MFNIRKSLFNFHLKNPPKNLLHPFNSLGPFNICDYMYLKSFCGIYVNPIVDSYHLLNLNVNISMFIVYSNKCICTSVLFVFLSTFPSCSYQSYLHQLVLLLLRQSRSSESPDGADLMTSFRPLVCSHCCIVVTIRTFYYGKDRMKPHYRLRI